MPFIASALCACLLVRPLAKANLAELGALSQRAGATGGIFLAFDRDGRALDSFSFGSPGSEGAPEWTPDVMVRIASVSKPITAEAIVRLVRAGRLTLDTPAFRYLGFGAPNDPRKGLITVDMLLRHRSGYSDSRSPGIDPAFDQFVAANALGVKTPLTTKQVVQLGFRSFPLTDSPGSAAKSYANFNFAVLGEIVEKASGKPYAAAVMEMLAEMKVSGIQPGVTLTPAPTEARYFEAGQPRLYNSIFRPGEKCPPAYGGYSLETILPFGGWIASINGLKSFVLQTAAKPGFTGLGWHEATGGASRKKIVFHGGSLEGANAFILYSEQGVGVVGLYNCGPGKSGAPLYNIIATDYLTQRL